MQLTYPGHMNVDPLTGNLSYTVTDVSIPCRGGMKLELTRYYSSISEHMSNGELSGWSFNFHERLHFEYGGDPARSGEIPNLGLSYVPSLLVPAPAGTPITLRAITVILPDWQQQRFVRANDGTFASVLPSLNILSQVGDTYVLSFPGDGCHRFRSDGALLSIEDVWGNRIQYGWTERDGPHRLTGIVDPAGRTLRVDHDHGTMTCNDWTGRSWIYRVESYRLTSYTDCEGNVTGYHYYEETKSEFGVTLEPVPPGVEIPGSPTLTSFIGMYKMVFPGGDFVVTYATQDRPMNKRVGVQVFGGRTAVTYVYDPEQMQTTKYVGDTSHRYVYQYDVQGNLVTLTDPLDNVYRYSYDSHGNLVRTIDPRLGVTTYEYDSLLNLTRFTDPLGNSVCYEYDLTTGEPSVVTGPDGDAYRYTYHPHTRCVNAETDPLGNVVSYVYDAHGHVVEVRRKRGDAFTYEYDPTSGALVRQQDSLGGVTVYEHDAVGRITQITTPAGRSTRIAYTPSGLARSVMNGQGGVWNYQYDGNRNLVAVTDPLGNATTFTYDVLNRLTSVTDAMGQVSSVTYTALGLVEEETDPKGRAVRYAYDLLGRRTAATDAMGHTTSWTHDPFCGTLITTDALGRSSSTFRDMGCRLTRMVAPDQGVVSLAYNPDSTLKSITDPLGNATLFTWDVLGRRVGVTDPLGRTMRMSYDAHNNVTAVVDPRGTPVSMEYDSLDRLVRVVRRDGTTVQFGYDADGLLTDFTDALGQTWTTFYNEVSLPVAMRDPLGNIGRVVHDALGRVVQTISPLGATTTIAYDALGRVVSATDALGHITSSSYDEVGNLVTVVDALNRATHLNYDALDRLINVVDPLGHVTGFNLDGVGNLVAVTDANRNTTSYQYDVMDRQVAEIQPDGSRSSCAYDAASRQVSSTNARGVQTRMVYDAASQLTQVFLEQQQGLGMPPLPYADGLLPDTPYIQFTYDVNGNVVQRQEPAGTWQMAFDVEDRITRLFQPDGSSYQVAYDANGNRSSFLYPDGRREGFTYDEAGRRTALQASDGASITFRHDADGRPVGVSYPNGTLALAEYDELSRLVRRVHRDAAGGNLTPDLRLAYDAYRLTSVQDGTTPLWSYAYDRLDRLISATDHANSRASSWSYDPLGNRLTETVNGATTSYAYNALNQLVQADDTGFSYDAAGNMIARVGPAGVTRYGFDFLDRLVDVHLPDGHCVAYTYDTASRMLTRADSSAGITRFEWDGWNMVREIDPAGSVTRYFPNGMALEGFARNDTHYRLHSDWLGSVRAVTDSQGSKVAQFDYDPWGNELSSSYDNVPGGMPYRFVGSLGVRHDQSTGMHYMRHRWYEPGTGRFLSRDILNTENRHVYAANNPVLSIDPLGLSPNNPKDFTPQDVFNDPWVLYRVLKKGDAIEVIAHWRNQAAWSGWKQDDLNRSTSVTSKGGLKLTPEPPKGYIQYHNGGGHHGTEPYFKVSYPTKPKNCQDSWHGNGIERVQKGLVPSYLSPAWKADPAIRLLRVQMALSEITRAIPWMVLILDIPHAYAVVKHGRPIGIEEWESDPELRNELLNDLINKKVPPGPYSKQFRQNDTSWGRGFQ